MVQNLLAARFRLKVHHESKNLPVYELTISPKGSKVKLVDQRSASNRDPWNAVTLLIGLYLDYPVVDKTGLTGFLPAEFHWEDAGLLEEAKNGLPAPSIFSEVETQLGLKLNRVSQPSDYLVIEHVEHPTEN
jgi:hypothetical protein